MIAWRDYQRKLGEPERRPRLSLVPPPERVELPDHKREGRQMAIFVVLLCAALFALVGAVAAWVR